MSDTERTAMLAAIKPGEETSEHAVMAAATESGGKMAMIGVGLAIGTQILDAILSYAHMLPESLQQNSTIKIGLIVCGLVLALIGQVKAALNQITYIRGRADVKAAALAGPSTIEKKVPVATHFSLMPNSSQPSVSAPASEPSSPPSPPPS